MKESKTNEKKELIPRQCTNGSDNGSSISTIIQEHTDKKKVKKKISLKKYVLLNAKLYTRR